MSGTNLFKAVSDVAFAAMSPAERNMYLARLDGWRDYMSDMSEARRERSADLDEKHLCVYFFEWKISR